ncbi:LCP family protein [Gleimia hominis]|uniref:LCP family protein n=1 Tax=Gleimia hominis TaxID=595468 RepID=A0ABU3IAC9_9ACTO|nr:LCP family protein [Gleimia hominis]MDT3767333.1 LCP family protein [Gleimia hominis]
MSTNTPNDPTPDTIQRNVKRRAEDALTLSFPRRSRVRKKQKYRHATDLKTKSRWKKYVALAALAAVLFAVTFGGLLYYDLKNSLDNNALNLDSFEDHNKQPNLVDSYAGKALNVLVVGSDQRADQDFNQDNEEGMRNDVTMVLHISADRSRAQFIAIPRDTLMNLPACKLTNGSQTVPHYGQFNWALGLGAQENPKNMAAGVACVKKTTEALTGIDINEVMVVDFDGFIKTVETLGGIEMCFDEPIHDYEADLNIEAGCHVLNGDQALAYARLRHSLGSGSDLDRITRQQQMIGKIVATAKEKGLGDSLQLYNFVKTALESVKTSKNLTNLSVSAGLANSLKDIPGSGVQFSTMPVDPDLQDSNRVVPNQDTENMWNALKNDKPFPAGTTYRTMDGSWFKVREDGSLEPDKEHSKDYDKPNQQYVPERPRTNG